MAFSPLSFQFAIYDVLVLVGLLLDIANLLRNLLQGVLEV